MPEPIQLPILVSAPTGKFCPGCDTDKVRSDFFPNTARRDGLSTYCRSCGSNPAAKAGPKRMLPAEPIVPRLRRTTLMLAYHEHGNDFGVRRLATQMAATFGGDPEVYRVQIDRLLRGDLETIHRDSADRLAIAVGGSAPEIWRGAW